MKRFSLICNEKELHMLVDDLIRDDEVSAFFSSEAEISAMLKVEAALAAAQADHGLIRYEAAQEIVSVCRNFAPDMRSIAAAMAKDGVAVLELVRQLRSRVNPDFSADVHFGATSQDIIDTGLTLRLHEVFDTIEKRLSALLTLLESLRRQQGKTGLMARTRMQAAMPFTVEDKIAGWKRLLRDILDVFPLYRQWVLQVQLGGPIGNAACFKGRATDIALHMAQSLGLHAASAWQTNRKPVMDAGHIFTLISGALGKIGQDIALMAQNEIAEIHVQASGGSSAMAHKNNPVSAEVLVTLGRFNAGLNGTLQQAMIHENERSGAAWTLEWLVLPQICMAGGASLRHAARLLTGAQFGNAAVHPL